MQEGGGFIDLGAQKHVAGEPPWEPRRSQRTGCPPLFALFEMMLVYRRLTGPLGEACTSIMLLLLLVDLDGPKNEILRKLAR